MSATKKPTAPQVLKSIWPMLESNGDDLLDQARAIAKAAEEKGLQPAVVAVVLAGILIDVARDYAEMPSSIDPEDAALASADLAGWWCAGRAMKRRNSGEAP